MENSSDIIEKVIIRLLRTNGVFFASLVQQCQRIELKGEQAKQLNTCGVTIKNGRILLYWNPKFFETLTLDEARAVLEHEMSHLVREHVQRFKERDQHIGNLACVPPNTFILGANKTIDKIKRGELVLGQSSYVEVREVMKRNYKGDLYKITPSSLTPSLFTNEHPILIARKHFSESHYPIVLDKPEWILAKDLKVNDYVLIPKLKCEKNIKELDLTKFIIERKDTSKGNLKCGKSLELTSSLAWLLGLYVADGTLTWDDGGIGYCLHPVKDKDLEIKIKKYFKPLGYVVDGTTRETKFFAGKMVAGARVVKINSAVLGRAFSNWCGRGAKNKLVPDFILFNKDAEIRKAFLEGYMEGDGHHSPRDFWLGGTVSEGLALQLQLLILSLGDGSWSRINKRTNNGFKKGLLYEITWTKPKPYKMRVGNKIVTSFHYRFKDLGDYFAVPVKQIEKVKYNGPVYNLSTSSHTFVVGNFITHNCDLAQNQFITGLPKDSVQLDKFPKEWKLKEKESAEYYYDEMMKHANKISVSQNADGSYHVKITDPKGKVISEFDVNDMDGSEWKDSDTSELSKEVVRQAVKEAVDQMKRSQGTLPQGLELAVNEILQPPKIAWNQLLRQYIAASIKSGHKQSWKKPNRRFGATQKGRLSDHTIALTVAMDTSGSMGSEDYKIFFSELKSIQECYKADINVLECDAEVHRHFKLNKYKRHDGKPHGGGGTAFEPVFEYIKNKKLRCDVLIFFTDGFGSFPTAKYSFRTIWVSTSDWNKPPFGRCIRISDYPTREK